MFAVGTSSFLHIFKKISSIYTSFLDEPGNRIYFYSLFFILAQYLAQPRDNSVVENWANPCENLGSNVGHSGLPLWVWAPHILILEPKTKNKPHYETEHWYWVADPVVVFHAKP